MINAGDADANIGKSIKKMREAKGMSREALAEVAGVSESHLKKIESGTRRPGISSYHRILKALDADIVIENSEEESVKGGCIKKAREILMGCNDKQALYLVKVLEYSAHHLQAVELQ
mgnify:CR=1 FL=1